MYIKVDGKTHNVDIIVLLCWRAHKTNLKTQGKFFFCHFRTFAWNADSYNVVNSTVMLQSGIKLELNWYYSYQCNNIKKIE